MLAMWGGPCARRSSHVSRHFRMRSKWTWGDYTSCREMGAGRTARWVMGWGGQLEERRDEKAKTCVTAQVTPARLPGAPWATHEALLFVAAARRHEDCQGNAIGVQCKGRKLPPPPPPPPPPPSPLPPRPRKAALDVCRKLAVPPTRHAHSTRCGPSATLPISERTPNHPNWGEGRGCPWARGPLLSTLHATHPPSRPSLISLHLEQALPNPLRSNARPRAFLGPP